MVHQAVLGAVHNVFMFIRLCWVLSIMCVHVHQAVLGAVHYVFITIQAVCVLLGGVEQKTPSPDQSLMFTRLDLERNAKIMKKAVMDQRLDADRYKVRRLEGVLGKEVSCTSD